MNIVVKKNQNEKFPYTVESATGERLSSRPFKTKQDAMEFADSFLQGKSPKIPSPDHVPSRIIDETGEPAVTPAKETFGFQRKPGQEAPHKTSEGHEILRADGGGRVLQDIPKNKTGSEEPPEGVVLTPDEIQELKTLVEDLRGMDKNAPDTKDLLRQAEEQLADIEAAVAEASYQAGTNPKFLSHE